MNRRLSIAGPVVITGHPEWFAAVSDLARDHGFVLVTLPVPTLKADLIGTLVDQHAALLLVDCTVSDWAQIVARVATNPATRRIPAVVVTDDCAELASAADAGATQALRPDELEEMLPRLLAAQGRVLDAEHMAALECACTEPLPAEGLEAIRLFNAGEFYRQHDLFEALWMAEDSPVRNLYRAILQIGVGYYHIERGNLRGALKMLLRSLQWLTPLPDVCQGVDVARLRLDSARVRLALEAALDSGSTEIDRALFHGVYLVDDNPND